MRARELARQLLKNPDMEVFFEHKKQDYSFMSVYYDELQVKEYFVEDDDDAFGLYERMDDGTKFINIIIK